MHPQVTEFADLFEGFQGAYGAYKLTGEKDDTGKVLGKAYSLKGDITMEMWHDHLMGKQGLGVIPITAESKVKFGAIDIDEYPLDIDTLNKRVQDAMFPLVLCRTKSGGAHLYLFMREWTDAGIVHKKLREMAAYIGYGQSEIYPKQTRILVERGDVGQWINMPYFKADETERYGLNADGDKLDAKDFVAYAMIRKTEQLVLEKLDPVNMEILPGGPPCLNHLVRHSFPQGTRNNGLFNLGVYAQKRNPDEWQKEIEEFNSKYMDPPLSTAEVLAVIKSLNKKDYNYTCKAAPIMNYCNVNKCRGCKHGIGGSDVGLPKLGTLTKLDTSPPIWFIDVEGGGRLELQTEDLQNFIRFQNRCMEVLNMMPTMLKRDRWQEIVQKLLQDCNVVPVPREATPLGLLMQHLEEFCTSRVTGKTHDELLLGKPWTNNNKHYFRLKDFLKYLERQKFTEFKMNRIALYLRDMGGEKHFFNVKGKGVNCYSIPEFTEKQNQSFNNPEIPSETPY